MQFLLKHAGRVVFLIVAITLLLGTQATKLKIAFNFEQFFPENDIELEFYQDFVKEFGKDNNFLLLAVESPKGTIFDSTYLKNVASLTDSLGNFTTIKKVQSLTNLKLPVKTPFGYTLISALHVEGNMAEEKERLGSDDRFIGKFFNQKQDAICIFLNTQDELTKGQGDSLFYNMDQLLTRHGFNKDQYHILGQAFFQSELVRQQTHEVIISTIISAVLVFFILYLIFGSFLTSFISLSGIGISLAAFMGLLAVFGRELSVMSALYPVLILIVGSSDVIHLVSKYLDAYTGEANKNEVMIRVVKEVGMATFLTSATTAVGFATLFTSKLAVIRDFGINAGLGVMLAYVIVMIFIPCVLLLFNGAKLKKRSLSSDVIHRFALSAYQASYHRPGRVLAIIAASTMICVYGLSLVTTDYKITENLPRGEKVTLDFVYFEKEFFGFRTFEIALKTKGEHKVYDYNFIREMEKIENKIKSFSNIQSTTSILDLIKSLYMVENANDRKYYRIPPNEETYTAIQPILQKIGRNEFNIMVNRSGTATRISCKIEDIGADEIKKINQAFDAWVDANVDKEILSVKRTGTSLILDKNSEYITSNIFQGLILSMILISLLMSLVTKNIKMLMVSLVPNVLPLLFAGALLGFFGIELEAGISIIFAVIFGIAVDDTIHFIARYNQCRNAGMEVEESIHQTFLDTGKALVITTVILFFGFMVMLFSKNPASVTVGVLIAFTLISALLCDLYLLPLLIRKVFGRK